MKKHFHPKHHPHFKRRAILELVGLFVLIGISVTQWEIVYEALETISKVQSGWFIVLLSCFWIILPLTALSYKFISPKPKNLKLSNATLAHLAGAGPGRIIPGGIGNMSISALHLKKTGLSIEQSASIVVLNNIIGILVSAILVIIAVVIKPDVIDLFTNRITSQQLVVVIGLSIGLIVLFQWLFHARNTRKEARKTLRQGKKVLENFASKPNKVFATFIIAIIIAAVHTLMIDFSAFALGVDISITDALIALSVGVAVGSLFPTPGGFGAVEAGIAATFIVLGYDPAISTSIALLFRVATYWQPLIPGTLAYFYLRERKLL